MATPKKRNYISGLMVNIKDCPDCNGSGETGKCTCSCGNEHEIICDTCEGNGYIEDKEATN